VTPWVMRLLAANVIMYFIQRTVPGFTDALLFVPALALLHPWTIVTYMFLHASLTHIFFNMLVLYFFGPRVESRMGSSRFITLYMLSGVSGAVLSFALAPHAAVLGASGAIMGVMLAFARYWPRDKIFIWGIIPVDAWLLVAITTVMSLFSGFGGSQGGVADFAHLGGFAGSALYLWWLDRMQGTKRFRTATAARLPKTETLTHWRKVDPKSVHEVNRDEVNRILDKISKSGLGSLTLDERVFLSNFVPLDDRVPPVS
jgi:membrane associated rhomboid family serine protease